MKKQILTFTGCIFYLYFIVFKVDIAAQVDPAELLSETISGWKVSEQDRFFNDSTLYDYIDGGAELFISYGFTKVFNRNYSRTNQPDITVDIFYMNSSADAYGVFMHSTGRIENDFGNQSQTTKGSVIFWKDNFYVSIMSNPETAESKAAMANIAGIIDKFIPDKGNFPPIINLLPEANLDKKSIRYFKHYIWLNTHTFISNDNILNINEKVNCVQAKYKINNSYPLLLLLQYPDIDEAGLARELFIEQLEPKLSEDKIIKTEKHKWIGLDLHDNYLIAVFNCVNKKSALKLLDSVNKKIK